MSDLIVRDYEPSDEPGWLRCRVLAFLNTAYFDDVATSKPTYESSSIELIAVRDGELVGLMDVAYEGEAATIETVAVLPEASREGVGTALLTEAIRRLPESVSSLDAWTREDAAANAWYDRNGFTENFRYLHVFAGDEAEAKRAVTVSQDGLLPVAGFFHAGIHREDQLRQRFRRVHVCRQYMRVLTDE